MKAAVSLLLLLALSTPALAHDEKPKEKAETSVADAEKKKSDEIVANANANKMSKFTYAVGGIIGTYPGFGLGHTIQGRWSERGWVFTTGELGSLLILSYGLAQCLGDIVGDTISNTPDNNCGSGDTAITIGAVGFVVFKIWEIVDVWATPLTNNMVAFNITPPTEERPTMFSLALRY
jgi:hypothetical protein